jgi:LmbE family N-acetylglucosaminyl deacetylase
MSALLTTAAAIWGTVGVVMAALGATPPPTRLEVRTGERLLVVAPHPDDETLGAGGLIQRVLARGGTVRVVLVTAGDGYVEAVIHETGRPRPRPADYIAYGERRLREARLALRALGGDGIHAEHLLGFPDGGLESLLTAHWRRTHPERSPTTGATESPYADAEHRDRDWRYDGDDLRAGLVRCLRELRPTLVALPDPLDRHPDHRATGLFTLLAVDDWTGERTVRRAAMPRLLAYLVHWPNWPPGWDATAPLADAPNAPLELPPALPERGLARTLLTLTDAEVATKARALSEYETQQEETGSLLGAFVRRTEPFTIFTAAEGRHVGQMIERRTTDDRGLP